MKSLQSQRIIKEIAREHGYTEKEILDMVKNPFDFLVDIMRNSDRENLEFPSVRIKYFATFYCSELRKKYFRNLKKKVDARRELQSKRADIIPVFTEGNG